MIFSLVPGKEMNTSKLMVIALILAQLLGCATNPPQAPDYLASKSVGPNAVIQKVALVKILAPPEIESVDLGYTRGQGAAAGAAFGALSGYNAWLNGGECEGAFCGAVILLLPVFVITGALVGGIVGADTGYSEDTLKEAETNARARLHSAYLQTQLIDHAIDYANHNLALQFIRMPSADPRIIYEKPNFAALSAEGFDHVFELELTRLSFGRSRFGSDTPYLKMEARARLVSVDTGAVLSDERYKFLTEQRPLEDWAANGAAMLTAGIENGLQKLAKDVVDENFLLFYPIKPVEENLNQSKTTSVQTQKSQSKPVPPHYVLKPIYPALEYCFFCEGPFSNRRNRTVGNLKFVEINSTQPRLRWERFPRAHDHFKADGRHLQISDVRYDIKVFESGLPYSRKIIPLPRQLVYIERNIIEPYHKANEVLSPCADYFWTVRARFKLSGRERVTEWAGAFPAHAPPWKLRRVPNKDKDPLQVLLRWSPQITNPEPEWFYYPFRTPCD
jgi:hypothetical protein